VFGFSRACRFSRSAASTTPRSFAKDTSSRSPRQWRGKPTVDCLNIPRRCSMYIISIYIMRARMLRSRISSPLVLLRMRMDAVSRESREIFFPFPSIIREELFTFF
jgi:hypothetical protein